MPILGGIAAAIPILLYRKGLLTKGKSLLLILLAAVSCLLLVREQLNGTEHAVSSIERGEKETADQSVAVEVELPDGDRLSLDLPVSSVPYTGEERQALFEEAAKELDTEILGENTSLLEVCYNLNLPSSVSEPEIALEWTTDAPSLLNWDGTLGSEIPDSGAEVELKAVMTLQGDSAEYIRQVVVYPSRETDQVKKRILSKTEELNADNTGTDYVLPESVDGQSISWYRPVQRTGLFLALLTILSALLLVIAERRKGEDLEAQRQQRLLRVYPELVGKMQMLMGAGLGMRSVFRRIAADYLKQKREEQEPAYEELVRVVREMENGLGELQAYERFGSRCGNRSYRGLALLLVQNRKKGGQGMIRLLEQEAVSAMEDRKRRAREAGEKASVKLLLPMGLMLVVVLILVMVPAFLSF